MCLLKPTQACEPTFTCTLYFIKALSSFINSLLYYFWKVLAKKVSELLATKHVWMRPFLAVTTFASTARRWSSFHICGRNSTCFHWRWRPRPRSRGDHCECENFSTCCHSWYTPSLHRNSWSLHSITFTTLWAYLLLDQQSSILSYFVANSVLFLPRKSRFRQCILSLNSILPISVYSAGFRKTVIVLYLG